MTGPRVTEVPLCPCCIIAWCGSHPHIGAPDSVGPTDRTPLVSKGMYRLDIMKFSRCRGKGYIDAFINKEAFIFTKPVTFTENQYSFLFCLYLDLRRKNYSFFVKLWYTKYRVGGITWPSGSDTAAAIPVAKNQPAVPVTTPTTIPTSMLQLISAPLLVAANDTILIWAKKNAGTSIMWSRSRAVLNYSCFNIKLSLVSLWMDFPKPLLALEADIIQAA